MHRKQKELESNICNELDQLKITMFGRRIHNPNPLQGKRVNLNNHKPKELYTSDDFGITNDERLHTKVTHYLFHFGTLNEPPIVTPGSDIEMLKWVAVTNIELSNRKVKNDFPICESYLLQTLPRALKKLRELELAHVTDNVFIKYKSLGAHIFSDPFSLAACEYHQSILAKAIRISKHFKIQFEDIQKVDVNQIKS